MLLRILTATLLFGSVVAGQTASDASELLVNGISGPVGAPGLKWDGTYLKLLGPDGVSSIFSRDNPLEGSLNITTNSNSYGTKIRVFPSPSGTFSTFSLIDSNSGDIQSPGWPNYGSFMMIMDGATHTARLITRRHGTGQSPTSLVIGEAATGGSALAAIDFQFNGLPVHVFGNTGNYTTPGAIQSASMTLTSLGFGLVRASSSGVFSSAPLASGEVISALGYIPLSAAASTAFLSSRPPGFDTNLLINDNGAFGATNSVTWNKAAGLYAVDGNMNLTNAGGQGYSVFGSVVAQQSPSNARDHFYFGNTNVSASQPSHSVSVFQEFDGDSDNPSNQVGLFVHSSTGRASAGNLTTSGNGGALVNRFLISHNGSGNVARASAVDGLITGTGTGSLTVSAVFNAEAPAVAASEIWASHSGLRVNGGSIQGVVTTRYGVRVDTLCSTCLTAKYAFYAESDPSFFGGAVTLGNLTTGIAHSGTGGLLTSSPVDLATADVMGNLPVAHLNNGAGASGSTCWHGDGAWGPCGGPAKGPAASIPANCSTGEQYFSTDSTAGRNLYFCTGANTWTQQLASGTADGALTKGDMYLTDGTNYYMPRYFMQQAVLPTGTGYTTVNSLDTMATISAEGHGRKIAMGSRGAASYGGEFEFINANTNHESAFRCNAASFSRSASGIFLQAQGGCAVCFRESFTGKALCFGPGRDFNTTAGRLGRHLAITAFSNGTAVGTQHYEFFANGDFEYRLRVDGTRIYLDVSDDGGNNWMRQFSDSYTAWFASAPDQWGEAVIESGNSNDDLTTMTILHRKDY
jgi:hypothetical protein